MSSGGTEIDRRNATLRDELRQRRRIVHSERHLTAAADLCARFFTHFGDTLAGKNVAAYWPIQEEIDIRPLLDGLPACDAVSLLPVMGGDNQPLTFRRWRCGDELFQVSFGVCEPDSELPRVEPDIVIVPLLGFDADGNRIGYGGGYYDRTLASLRGNRDIVAVGVAYDAQECEKIPAHAGDARLDMVLTERRTIVPRNDESTD